MAASMKTTSIMNLKLLIDSRGQRVLFAEAGKDFVDFLFTLMSLPVGTVTNLLSSNAMVGTLGKLYQSIENLDDIYVQPNIDKETLLNPKPPALYGANPIPLLLPNNNIRHEHEGKNMYVCSQINICNTSQFGARVSGHLYVADDSKAMCPQCKNRMSVAVNYVVGGKKIGENELHSISSSSSASCGEGGFVKGVVTYMVMDDLEVSPMSTISSIAILNKFDVKEVGALQEKMVSFGMNECELGLIHRD
ncbi:uncharacterized protein LOC125421388 isoform X2 [Ziziphus jujuba]|uniref:Uncharacterized protein LOC125421388 isoform X2 n=1 Tax=Ziziphus jujuba TaxID=326968 RepID=A0ABM4AF77_ZIZJJ|nr:uncharacterized protein LOC125421388 isoform X2 [Ziziphus jujuba]